MIENLTEKEPDNNVIAEVVLKKVQQRYKLAGIPKVRKDLIKDRVTKVYMKRLILQKIPFKRRFVDSSAKTPTPFFSRV